MAIEKINEGSSGYLTVTFKDKNGVEQEPTSVSYRINDGATGVSIRAATSVAPGESVEIHLTASDNRIINSTQTDESRRVTVVASYGAGDQVTAEYLYYVVPMLGVDGNPPVIVP